MASRTWLAVILCFFVWFGYLKWFAPPPPKPKAAQTTPTETSAPSANQTSSESAKPAEVFVPKATGEVLRIENSDAIYNFSSLGGKPVEITLKGFHQTVDDSSPPISSLSKEKMGYGLATLFTDPKLKDFAFGSYQAKQNEGGVVYRRSANGISVKKTYSVSKEGYLSALDLEVSFPKSSDRRDWGYLLVPLGGQDLEYELQEPLKSWEVVALQNDSLTRKTWEDLEEAETIRGQTAWVAFGNRYFSTAVVNQSKVNPDVEFTNDSKFRGAYLRYPLKLKSGENTTQFSFQIYSGPKDLKTLTAVPGLKQLVDFGMFSVVAYPLLRVLKFFYGYVENYGVAIILLTILVRLIFFPLTAKSMKSMKSMQKLQPQIAALKEKYKDDRDRLNREQMALFKTHKVNPAAGCLPMLIQLPVFIALYQVLANSMELFHSPFFGWINDLSSKDPYYIYPILMGVSMFAQQKMTPNAGMEPAQQKMMMLMPIIFTFLMVSLPSGLTLYIFVSTLLGIVQQVFTNKESSTAPITVKAKRAPEKS